MIKYNFYIKKIFYFLFYINKNLKILTKQNVRTIIKFLSYIIKILNIFTKKKVIIVDKLDS